MEVLQDGVLAFLAATGAAALFWLLTGWLRRREPARAVLLVPARGSGDFSGPVAQRYDNVLLLAPEEIIQNLP